MRILIDIGHPSHVHLFKHFAIDMQKRGHEFLFTCREKEFEKDLLASNGFNYVSFGKKYKKTIFKILGLFKFDWLMLQTALRFKPDIFLSHGSPYAAQIAWLLRKTHLSFEDTFNMEQIRLYLPFTKHLLTSDYQHPFSNHPKNITYKGYHELAYLHPKRFVPDITVLKKLQLKQNDRYILIRFVSWNATHDRGHVGISYENKIKLIERLLPHVRIFISSEGKLPDALQKYQLKIDPKEIHHVLAYASLLFGESSTMSEEAAMLGVPSVYLFNNSTIYTTHLQEKYGLIYNFSESEQDQLAAIELAYQIITDQQVSQDFKVKQQKMLSDKIDVTAFLTWFVEQYPKSVEQLKSDPDYQNKFK